MRNIPLCTYAHGKESKSLKNGWKNLPKNVKNTQKFRKKLSKDECIKCKYIFGENKGMEMISSWNLCRVIRAVFTAFFIFGYVNVHSLGGQNLAKFQ